jgi:hypothetical protein
MKSGHSFEEALPIAIGIMKTWAAGGPTYGHKSHATPATMAKAAAALKHWEQMKSEAHSGASRRSTIEQSMVRGNGSSGNAGAVAPGHNFWGNQHTGSLGKQQKQAQAKTASQAKASAAGAGKLPAQPNLSGQASSIIASAGQANPAVAAQNAATASSTAATNAYYAQQQALQTIQLNNAVATSTAAYNTAKDTVGETQAQQAQNVAFTKAVIHNTASASTNEQNQEKIQAVQLQASNSNQQAQDRLKNAQVALMGAMKAAGFRSPEEWPAGVADQILLSPPDALTAEEWTEQFRDAFVGEAGTSGAANFLPAGPSAKQDARIKKRLKEPETRPTDRDPEKIGATHWFQGENRNVCEVCGEPMTSPKHEHVDPHGATGPAIINKTASVSGGSKQASFNFPLQGRAGDGIIDPPEDPNSPWHEFEGTDLSHCDVCGGGIAEPQHTKGSGQGAQVQEAAESAPGVPLLSIPDQASLIRSAGLPSPAEVHEANVSNMAIVEAPLEDALKSHFEEQKRSVVGRLLGKRGGRMLKRAAQAVAALEPSVVEEELEEPTGDQVELDPGDVFDQSFWAGRTAQVLEPHLHTAASLAINHAKSQVNAIDDNNNGLVAIDAAHSEMRSRAAEAARAVTQTTSLELSRALQAGVARGEDRAQLRARLEHVFENALSSRAQQIAQTQVNGAYNQAGLTYAKQLPEGVVGAKVWLARMDEKTRLHHRLANAQQQDLGHPYIVGGVPMQYPGDTRAPIDEWAGCRCSQAFLKPGESFGAVSKAAAAYATAPAAA